MSAALKVNNPGIVGVREPLDGYQTPRPVTEGLIKTLYRLGKPLKGPILEPAAGCGLIAKELRANGYKVHTSDITRGRDFLKRTQPWTGDLVTNPPYRSRLDEAFLHQALSLVDGRICLLLQTSRLHGGRRHKELWSIRPPELVLIVPWRVMFLHSDGVTPISGQGYDHSWFVWNNYHIQIGDVPEPPTRVAWLDPPGQDYMKDRT